MGRRRHNRIAYILTVLLVLLISAVSPAVSFAASKGSSDVAGTVVDIASMPMKAAKGVLDPTITRKEVYRLKAGRKISRKEIKERGGASKYFQIYKIRKGDRVYKRMIGKSYRLNSNIGIRDLRYIKTLYCDFDGKVRVGEIVVNQSIAKDTKDVFRELYKVRYQISKMQLIDNYFPDDDSGSGTAGRAFTATDADTASMNDDNTSGFNYRMVAGTSSLSMHGYGRAIDVNPFENPWCPGGSVYYNQKKSAQYANRFVRRPHMIFADSDITQIFRKHGFRWLGAAGARDYQHFEK